jgi:hypothetical protein
MSEYAHFLNIFLFSLYNLLKKKGNALKRMGSFFAYKNNELVCELINLYKKDDYSAFE